MCHYGNGCETVQWRCDRCPYISAEIIWNTRSHSSIRRMKFDRPKHLCNSLKFASKKRVRKSISTSLTWIISRHCRRRAKQLRSKRLTKKLFHFQMNLNYRHTNRRLLCLSILSIQNFGTKALNWNVAQYEQWRFASIRRKRKRNKNTKLNRKFNTWTWRSKR